MMTLPQSAVLLRDGFSYVMRIGPTSKVIQTKVSVGRRAGDRIEITDGIEASARVVESGGSFLGDGDLVHVVGDPPALHTGGGTQ
jgi:multidrug efflux pump subunit AcrA (membrane-fusion protein)